MKRLLKFTAFLLIMTTCSPELSASTTRFAARGRDLAVQAESSPEARRVVMEMFGRSCVVTSINRIKGYRFLSPSPQSHLSEIEKVFLQSVQRCRVTLFVRTAW
jgi:hypothetical protein